MTEDLAFLSGVMVGIVVSGLCAALVAALMRKLGTN